MHENLGWLHDFMASLESVDPIVYWAITAITVVLISYWVGPGWLPHSTCPYCCWCSSRVPFGTRVERRVKSALLGEKR